MFVFHQCFQPKSIETMVNELPLTYKTFFQKPLILKPDSELFFLKKKCYHVNSLPGHQSLTAQMVNQGLYANRKYYIVFMNGKCVHYTEMRQYTNENIINKKKHK